MSEQDPNQPEKLPPQKASPSAEETTSSSEKEPIPIKAVIVDKPSEAKDSSILPEQQMAKEDLSSLPEESADSQKSSTTTDPSIVEKRAPDEASGSKQHLEVHWLNRSGEPLLSTKTGTPVVIGRPASQGDQLSTVENFEKAGFYYLGVPAKYEEIGCVSGIHALVDLSGGDLSLKDLNSTQGLKLNGKVLEGKGGVRHPFNSDDTILLAGQVLFKVKIVEGPFNDSPKILAPATSVSIQEPDPAAQADISSPKPEEHLVIDGGLDWDEVLQKCEMLISPPEEWDPTDLLNRTEAVLQKEGVMGLAFEKYRNDLSHQAFKVPELPPKDADLWFIGDIHGDLLGMESSLAYIHHQAKVAGKTPWVTFLGDFIDRGDHSHEVMLRLFEYIDANKTTTCAIVGNHDDGFEFSDGQFKSRMSPCDYPDWLEQNREDELAVRTGKLSAQFFDKIPRAFFLPDGLIVAHGCVPHKDITPEFKCEDDLNGKLALSDFVNARIQDWPRKKPNRASSTHQLGREDFDIFCEKATEILEQPVSRMVKGHEHIDERYCIYKEYFSHNMLVINNMCTSQGDFVMGGPHPPRVARWREGQPPEVHSVKIPSYLIEKIYKLSGANGESEDTMNKD